MNGEGIEQLPLPTVEINIDVEWGDWLEATYDPDNAREIADTPRASGINVPIDRLEDLET